MATLIAPTKNGTPSSGSGKPLPVLKTLNTPAPETSPADAAASIPGAKGAIVRNAGDAISQASDIASDPLNLKATPIKFLEDQWSKYVQKGKDVVADVKDVFSKDSSIGQKINDVSNAASTVKTAAIPPIFQDTVTKSVEDEAQHIKDIFSGDKTAGDRINSALLSVAGGAGVVFSPISALFQAAEQVPVLGTATKLMNFAFTTFGDAGGAVASHVILPALPISKEIKERIQPGLNAIGQLAGQIIGGDVIVDGAIGKLKEQFGATDAETIVNKAYDVAKERAQAPDGSLAVNKTPEAGAPAPTPKTEGLSTTEVTELKKRGYDDATIEKINNNAKSRVATDPESAPDSGTAGTETVAAPAELGENGATFEPDEESSGPKAKSKVGQSIETKLSETFGDTAEFDVKDVAGQAKRISDIIENDPDRINRFLSGEEKLPKEINPGYFIKAVEDYATQTGNWELSKSLAQSSIVSGTSEAAQTLRFLQERDPESPLAAIESIVKNRKDIAEKQGDVAPETVSKSKLAEFIKKLEC